VSALVTLLVIAAVLRLYRFCAGARVGQDLLAWCVLHSASLVLAAVSMVSVAGGCSSLWVLALLPAAAASHILHRLTDRGCLVGSLTVISAAATMRSYVGCPLPTLCSRCLSLLRCSAVTRCGSP
jgi:hypothetical protein